MRNFECLCCFGWDIEHLVLFWTRHNECFGWDIEHLMLFWTRHNECFGWDILSVLCCFGWDILNVLDKIYWVLCVVLDETCWIFCDNFGMSTCILSSCLFVCVCVFTWAVLFTGGCDNSGMSTFWSFLYCFCKRWSVSSSVS